MERGEGGEREGSRRVPTAGFQQEGGFQSLYKTSAVFLRPERPVKKSFRRDCNRHTNPPLTATDYKVVHAKSACWFCLFFV